MSTVLFNYFEKKIAQVDNIRRLEDRCAAARFIREEIRKAENNNKFFAFGDGERARLIEMCGDLAQCRWGEHDWSEISLRCRICGAHDC